MDDGDVEAIDRLIEDDAGEYGDEGGYDDEEDLAFLDEYDDEGERGDQPRLESKVVVVSQSVAASAQQNPQEREGREEREGTGEREGKRVRGRGNARMLSSAMQDAWESSLTDRGGDGGGGSRGSRSGRDEGREEHWRRDKYEEQQQQRFQRGDRREEQRRGGSDVHGITRTVVNIRDSDDEDADSVREVIGKVGKKRGRGEPKGTATKTKFTITLGPDINPIAKDEEAAISRVAEESDIVFPNAKRQRTAHGAKKQERCQYWPNCTRGASCAFVHPSEVCKRFPRCPYGDKCLYIHVHPGGRKTTATQARAKKPTLCRFGFACKGRAARTCTFGHPKVACRNGSTCKRGLRCAFSHAPVCRFGVDCARPDCSFGHTEESPAGSGEGDGDVDVGGLSASLPQTPPREQASSGAQGEGNEGADHGEQEGGGE